MLQPIMNTVQSFSQLQRSVSGVFSTTFKSQIDRAHLTPDAAIQKPTETGTAPETVFSPVPTRLYGGPPEMVFSPVPNRWYGGPPEMVFSPVPNRWYGGPPEMVFSAVPCQINCGTSEDGAITNGKIKSAEHNVYDKYFSIGEPCFQIIG
jgi:hypothetical protein